jgi:hypothetical protein
MVAQLIKQAARDIKRTAKREPDGLVSHRSFLKPYELHAVYELEEGFLEMRYAEVINKDTKEVQNVIHLLKNLLQ